MPRRYQNSSVTHQSVNRADLGGWVPDHLPSSVKDLFLTDVPLAPRRDRIEANALGTLRLFGAIIDDAICIIDGRRGRVSEAVLQQTRQWLACGTVGLIHFDDAATELGLDPQAVRAAVLRRGRKPVPVTWRTNRVRR